jgi:pyruvate/oxaloacetate carboxyltransferase
VKALVLHNKELTDMASSGKKKTTMAKLTRESRLRERRLDKQAKKDARKLAPAHHADSPADSIDAATSESSQTDSGPALETVVQALADA